MDDGEELSSKVAIRIRQHVTAVARERESQHGMMNTTATSKEIREHDVATDTTGWPVATLSKSGLEPPGGARTSD